MSQELMAPLEVCKGGRCKTCTLRKPYAMLRRSGCAHLLQHSHGSGIRIYLFHGVRARGGTLLQAWPTCFTQLFLGTQEQDQKELKERLIGNLDLLEKAEDGKQMRTLSPKPGKEIPTFAPLRCTFRTLAMWVGGISASHGCGGA